MRHHVEDDIDAKRIGDPFGVLIEISLVRLLAFPAVADVAVVDGQYHDPPMVVEQGANVHFLGAFAAEDGLLWGIWMGSGRSCGSKTGWSAPATSASVLASR